MPESLPGDWSKLCQVFASSLLDNDHVGKAKEYETKAAELQHEAVLKIISAAVRISRIVCLTDYSEGASARRGLQLSCACHFY